MYQLPRGLLDFLFWHLFDTWLFAPVNSSWLAFFLRLFLIWRIVSDYWFGRNRFRRNKPSWTVKWSRQFFESVFLNWSPPVFSESKPAATVKILKPHQLGSINPLHLSDQIYLVGQHRTRQSLYYRTVWENQPLNDITIVEGAFLLDPESE